MNVDEFKAIIDVELGADTVLSIDENATPKAIVIAPEQVLSVGRLLRDNERTLFDLLSCLTVVDNGPEVQNMEVIYNLYSIPLDHSLMVKATLDRDNPEIETVSDLWQTANWHEREAYDLFGVKFNNHPDLRRILMPADWEGHPMLKDYEEPPTYRGMKTIREEGDPV